MSTQLAVGQRLPFVSLPTATGGCLRLSAYRGRASLAVYLLPTVDEAARDLLTAIAGHLPAYQERHAQPIAIVGCASAEAAAVQTARELPFPVATDPAGRVVAALAPLDPAGRGQPAVALTDRYAELRVHLTDPEALLPDYQPEILEWLTYLDCLCSC